MSGKVFVVQNDGDYQECLAIRRRVFVEEQKVPVQLEVDEYEEECAHFLYRLGDVPVATGRIRRKEFIVKFERIATLKEYRGKSIGRALMNSMQVYAESNFSDCLPFMNAQVSAVNFYLKLGWSTVGTVFQEAGIDHLAMALIPKQGINAKLKHNLLSMADLPESLITIL